jgi:hypothetical protein
LNDLQFALHQTSIVDDMLTFVQMFTQIHDENRQAQDALQAETVHPQVSARVKFDGFSCTMSGSSGSTLLFDTRVFEFVIDSRGNKGESVSITAELDPVFCFGQMDATSAMLQSNPNLCHFNLHAVVSFEKTGACDIHAQFNRTCAECLKSESAFAFVVKIKNPSIYLPPEAIKSAVEFAWEYNQATVKIAHEVSSSFLSSLFSLIQGS